MNQVQIRQMVHANICVRDMERTVPFYEMLGFEKFADQVFEPGAGVWRGLGLESNRVHRDGVTVVLTRKEYALLLLLLEHAGRVVTQPHILRTLWGTHHVHDTHYLRILVAKLRAKLGDDAASPTWIATEAGVGLRFIGRSCDADALAR